MKLFLHIAFALSLVACARLPEIPHVAASGGDWESSGGGGVACFETADQARLADARARDGKDLGELAAHLTKVVTLDFWEAETGLRLEAVDLDPQLEAHAPIFYAHYRLVRSRIDEGAWSRVGALPRVEDAHPARPLDANCALVQLVVRYTRSTPGRFPEARLETDGALYARLDPTNRAMLVAHERLYLLAKETPTAHRDSDAIRPLVARLFSREWKETLAGLSPAMAGIFVQNKLASLFGDYYQFFLDDPTAGPAVPSSRYRSFGTLLVKLRARRKKSGDYNEAVFGAGALDGLTPEEAYLYVARWKLVPLGLIDNAESLLDFGPRPSADIGRACDAIASYHAFNVAKPYPRAHAYCESLGLLPRPLRRLTCEGPGRAFTLEREAAGTFSLALSTGTARSGLYCMRVRSTGLALTCVSDDFSFRAIDTVRIDPDSDKKTSSREVGWGNGGPIWRFSDGAPENAALGECRLEE